MNKSNKEKIQLALFVLIGTMCLIVASYLIGNNQNLFGNTFDITTRFKNVNGLQKGNNVRFAGINVGTVNDIEMINDTVISVHMVVENEMLKHIRRDAIATIGSDGLVGSMIINILPGEGVKDFVAEDDEIESFSRSGTDDMLGTLSLTNKNAALLTFELLKIAETIQAGEGTIGRLLSDTTMAIDIQETFNNLNLASYNTNKSIHDLQEILKQLSLDESVFGAIANDTVNGEKMDNIISNVEASSERLHQTISDVNLILQDFRNEDGMINHMLTDSSMVKKINATLNNIEIGSQRFSEDMEALKHNFLFRGYFKRQEKMRQKELKNK